MKKAPKKKPDGLVAPLERDRPHLEPGRPAEDTIRRRAYEISVSRGGAPGHEIEDWVQAERELEAR